MRRGVQGSAAASAPADQSPAERAASEAPAGTKGRRPRALLSQEASASPGLSPRLQPPREEQRGAGTHPGALQEAPRRGCPAGNQPRGGGGGGAPGAAPGPCLTPAQGKAPRGDRVRGTRPEGKRSRLGSPPRAGTGRGGAERRGRDTRPPPRRNKGWGRDGDGEGGGGRAPSRRAHAVAINGQRGSGEGGL